MLTKRQLCCGLVLACLPQAAVAQFEPVHRGAVRVGGRTVVLPPGDWTEIGRSSELLAFNISGQQYGLERALLIQRQSERITGMVEVWGASSNPTMRINWNIPNTCTRQDTHANLTEQALQQSQDCLLINHVTTDPRVQPEQPLEHWRGFWRLARLEPQNVPRTALAAEISLAEGGNLLRVTYRFSTETHGFQPDPAGWANSGWHRSRLDPARRAHVERFQNWAQQARPIVRAGFMRGSISPLPPFR